MWGLIRYIETKVTQYTKKAFEKFKLFIELLKVNTLTRFITSLVLTAVSYTLSQHFPIWIYPAILFGIYPVWLTFWMLLYAWILNPIRDRWPNSKFSKILLRLDKNVNRW